MPTRTDAKNARYVSAYRRRKVAQGLVEKSMWIPVADVEMLRQFADWRCHLHEQREAG